MDDWKTILSIWDGLFSEAFAVSFRECSWFIGILGMACFFYPHDAGAVEFLISNQDLCLTTLIFQITWKTLPNHPTSMLDL